MTKKDLKLMASDIIIESEYPRSTKKQLLNFLKEADEVKIKSLILDGKVEEIAEDAIDIVNKRFDIMFENMTQENIEETQEFLTIGREIICKVIESQDSLLESKIGDLDTFEKTINFVINEASDYQILSMLMEDKLPENDDIDKYTILIENLNELAGTTFVSEQNINKKEIEEPKKKGLPFNPANLMYLMYLPSGLRSGILAKIKSVLVAGGGYIGGTAFAALLAYVAFKVYQSYLSKASISCKDSPDKQTCMINYKKKAKLLQIQQLQKGISQCVKTKNPDKCRVSIQNKINGLRSKIGKVA